MKIDRDAADGLHSVGVDWNTPLGRQCRQLANRLNRPGLVVCQHQGNESRLSAKQCGHLNCVGKPLAIDWCPIHGETGCFEPGYWLSNCRVLDWTTDYMPG
jgi:hypothetical protein